MLFPPQFGALVDEDGVRFRVSAPVARSVRLVLHDDGGEREREMTRGADGVWELEVAGIGAGQRYSYRLDDARALPDPASRFQPLGVHGPSEVVAAGTFPWTDEAWSGPTGDDLVVYELHVGTFSPSGTYDGVRERLPLLQELGITAIELMPLADFAGSRNWGYDGVALYAPSRAYGRPEDLRALVDRAHALGLAVILDVVYNHLGPEGAYLPSFNPAYLLDRHRTPWGAAVNLDGPGADLVRGFIIDNAVSWIREYHFDGLRLDATHALIDESPTHFVRELAASARACTGRRVVIHGEDHRNLDEIVRDDIATAWALDGVWADDFHHVVRRLTAGDGHGYYADFAGTIDELARTIRQGWLFTGEHSRHLNCRRGTDPSQLPMHRFVVCVQNHDQIGNRAFGERLHHQIDAAVWRTVSLVLLTAPMTPLLFMGQEWSASSPFQFFTDLEPGLGLLVTEGRRREFRDFPEFASPDARERIPDPQALSTFQNSKLRWEERELAPHAGTLALYRSLLHLRRREPALRASSALAGEAHALDADTVALRRASAQSTFWIVARFRGTGEIELGSLTGSEDDNAWETVLTTEDAAYCVDPMPPRVTAGRGGPAIRFERPGAVILRASRS